MNAQTLMPKATAIWLIENTALTFEQISNFCNLHPLEVQSLADEDFGVKIKGLSPIVSGQLTREEIERCEKNGSAQLIAREIPKELKKNKKTQKKYTPIARRQDKPDAINFLIRKYPVLLDTQICKLIGTTKTTVENIRAKMHWKMQSMRDIDPVIIGFCSQLELDDAVKKATARNDREMGEISKNIIHETLTDIE